MRTIHQSIGTCKLGAVGTLLRIVVLTTLTIELVLALVLVRLLPPDHLPGVGRG